MSGFEALSLQEQAELQERASAYLDPEEQNQRLYTNIVELLDHLVTEDRKQGTHRVGRIEEGESFAVFATGKYFGEPHRGQTPSEYNVSVGHVYYQGVSRAYVRMMRQSFDNPGTIIERSATAFQHYVPGSMSSLNRPVPELQFDACDWLDSIYAYDKTPRPSHTTGLRKQFRGEWEV